MRRFFAPQSILFLTDPFVFATPAVLGMMLRSRGSCEVVYAGDRMWPAVRHGDRIEIRAAGDPGKVAPGDVVVSAFEGAPDLYRVLACGGGAWAVAPDADPAGPRQMVPGDVLGVASVRPAWRSAPARALRALTLDFGEAVRGGASADTLPESTVRDRYEFQSGFYAAEVDRPLSPEFARAVSAHVHRGGKVLVAGCGTGQECLWLAREGWVVKGVDFSAGMIGRAREAAAARGFEIEYEVADLTRHAEPPGSLDAVVFTADVLSFIPGAAARVGLLASMARWLADGGVLLVSARRVRGIHARTLLTLERLFGAGPRPKEWGDSHARWIGPRGDLERSFVHLFGGGGLRREVARAGLRAGRWDNGWMDLRPGIDPAERTRR